MAAGAHKRGVDAALLTAMFHGFLAGGGWSEERGTNALDDGSHFYDVYETSDGRYVASPPSSPSSTRRFCD